MKWNYEPKLPEGEYQVTYFRHRLESRFGRPTLTLMFTLVELTEHNNAVLTKYFPIRRFNKKGGFSVKKSQEFARFWLSVFPNHNFSRMDRFPLNQLRGEILIAEVKDKTHDWEQKEIPEPLRVSKIVSLKPL